MKLDAWAHMLLHAPQNLIYLYECFYYQLTQRLPVHHTSKTIRFESEMRIKVNRILYFKSQRNGS